MYNLNCKVLMRDYLINRQSFFYYRTFIALFITLLMVHIIILNYSITVLPVLSIYFIAFLIFFIVLFLFNTIAVRSFSNEEYDALVRKCQLCMIDPKIRTIENIRDIQNL
jgi:hypothetical protein